MPGFNIPLQDCVDEDAFQIEAAFQGPAYTIETARKHRYRLEVLEPLGPVSASGQGGDGILLFLEKCTRPTPEVDEITIHNGQDEIYRPGKQRWNPIEFTFYEVLRGNEPGQFTDDSAEKLYKWWGEAMIDLQRSVHNPIANYYKRAQLQMLDGVGNPVWTYYLYDCWPQKVSPIELAYSDTDIATITVTLRYNKCEEQKD